MPVPFAGIDKPVILFPLKQFAPLFHGNRRAQGRIAMGSPRRKSVAFSSISSRLLNGPMAFGCLRLKC
ncbi:MAG: hypothetical protein C4518_10360 [Desulfobacteraceae bacterium]|nr:MAG: hypothetical protein C4518_10360 [Desulfobacteraceae bacterium]